MTKYIAKVIDTDIQVVDYDQLQAQHEQLLLDSKCDDTSLSNASEDDKEVLQQLRDDLDSAYKQSLQDYLPVEDPGMPNDIPETSRIEVQLKALKDKVVVVYNEVKNDEFAIQSLIDKLSNELASSDYKVAKINEARLLDPSGKSDPYDATVLLSERQKLRDRINELQQLIK